MQECSIGPLLKTIEELSSETAAMVDYSKCPRARRMYGSARVLLSDSL